MADDAVAARRSEMIAFLEGRKAERGAAKEARKTAMETARSETGSTNVARSSDEFWALFNAAVKAHREALEAAAQKGTVTDEEGRALWNAWMEACADMQAQLNDCTLFLAAFDVRKAQSIIDALLEAAEATKARILPRRKFAFSKRPTGTMAAAAQAHAAAAQGQASAAASADEAAVHGSAAGSTGGAGAGQTDGTATNGHATTAATGTARQQHLSEDELTIEGLSGQVVYIARGHYTGQARADLAALEKEIAAATADGSPVPAALAAARRRLAAQAAGRDLRLLSLTDCTVLLLDPMRAVRIDGLTRCTVITGTVAGSVLLHNCEDCTFHIAARQLRLHTSTRCDFYLHCLSRPIIEHCTAFRFAPYGVRFDGLEADITSAGLDKPSSPDLWRSVDDFGWHRVQASPNWSVLPAGQRAGEAGGSVLPAAATEHGISIAYPAGAAVAGAGAVGHGAPGPAAATAAAPATTTGSLKPWEVAKAQAAAAATAPSPAKAAAVAAAKPVPAAAAVADEDEL